MDKNKAKIVQTSFKRFFKTAFYTAFPGSRKVSLYLQGVFDVFDVAHYGEEEFGPEEEEAPLKPARKKREKKKKETKAIIGQSSTSFTSLVRYRIPHPDIRLFYIHHTARYRI